MGRTLSSVAAAVTAASMVVASAMGRHRGCLGASDGWQKLILNML